MAQPLATGAAIAAGTPAAPVQDVSLVSVIADVSAITKDSALVCAGSGKQAADGTWGITYTVTVKNTGTVGGVYDLDDTLRFGAGFGVGVGAAIGCRCERGLHGHGQWCQCAQGCNGYCGRKVPG
ncbi:hypothetical protein AOC05_13220 [Arthrobacter alpinus]|uniref:DUF11 domain-containing protein n=1 Tax=Arthrobacter alpinus TaxID=656366 RepID=A0A0M4QNT6_9MICC|nr:hypothetical protein AOC05_13220 [Arthrobacter alpinus]